jgi:hypothetical protein
MTREPGGCVPSSSSVSLKPPSAWTSMIVSTVSARLRVSIVYSLVVSPWKTTQSSSGRVSVEHRLWSWLSPTVMAFAAALVLSGSYWSGALFGSSELSH